MALPSFHCMLLAVGLATCAVPGCRPAPDPQSSTAAPGAAGAVARGQAKDVPVTEVPTAAVPGTGVAAPTDASPSGEPEFPTLTVQTVAGDAFTLASRRGKWVVVNFWATWCAPCLKEMPELSALDTMRDHVEVIGLAYDDIDPAALAAFLETHPVSYAIAQVDVYAPPADFATPRGLPMTYLVAPDGRIAHRFLGPVSASEIETAIAAAGGPAAAAG